MTLYSVRLEPVEGFFTDGEERFDKLSANGS
jgi:hypothetical protein